MRIGLDVRSLSTQQRYQGVGYYTRSLLAALAALDQKNAYVLFGGPEDETTSALMAGFRHAHYHQLYRPSSGGRLSEGWDQLLSPAEVAKYRLDLYFYPSLNNLAWWLPSVKVVMIQDLILSLFSKDLLQSGAKHRLMCAIARRADQILCPSESTRDDVARLMAVDPRRIIVTPLAVDGQFVPAQNPARRAAVARAYGIDRPFVLYVGDLANLLHNRRKNLPLLVRSFAALPESLRVSHQLVLAGKRGSYTAEVLNPLIGELGLANQVVFTDFVPEADLPVLYGSAALVAYPTRYEGFGLPVLQAMACGAPVLSTRISSIPEVVGDAGVLVEPDDEVAFSEALARLLGQEALRLDLGRQAYDRAQHFTWRRTATLTLEVFERLATRARRR